MRLVQKGIDVVCTFRLGEAPEPHRFRVKDQFDNIHIIKIRRICDIRKDKIFGSDVFDYKCQGMIGNQERVFVLRYHVANTRWELLKL